MGGSHGSIFWWILKRNISLLLGYDMNGISWVSLLWGCKWKIHYIIEMTCLYIPLDGDGWW